MLSAARRGPASIARAFLVPQKSPRCIKSLVTGFNSLPSVTRISSKPLIRVFSTTPRWNQESVSRAVQEEIDEDVDAYQQASKSNNHDTSQDCLITKFEDLATRKMVCQTVVDTITKDMGLETMTHVQSLTIDETLKGSDM